MMLGSGELQAVAVTCSLNFLRTKESLVCDSAFDLSYCRSVEMAGS
jgi:hypothetical protein